MLDCIVVTTRNRQNVATQQCPYDMPDREKSLKNETSGGRIKLTARVTLAAYDTIKQVQRLHRRRTGGFIPLWKVVDAAVRAYAKQKEIKI